jgi:hypothetical protein
MLGSLVLEVVCTLAQLSCLPLSALHQLLKLNPLRLFEVLLVYSSAGFLDVIQVRVRGGATLGDGCHAVWYTPVGGRDVPSDPVL